MGLRFRTPFGLAAGFDKNAVAVAGLGALGFGHVEVGTVTPKAQPGNPSPRLFRLPEDKGLINRMGFNNDGVAQMASRLRSIRTLADRPIVGVNIGKNRVTPAEEATADYAYVARGIAPLADYLVVNVSSPNTPGLRALGDVRQLEPLVEAVIAEAGSTPVLVKVSPDAADEELREVAEFVASSNLAGLVATNTTVRREGLLTPAETVKRMGEGGVSGSPLASRSLEVLEMVRGAVGDKCVISVGGVMTGSDVQARLDAGADLVQAYTAFVYRGPFLARHIEREMAA
jgi:dihydroorotate dehydrogenase